MKVSGQWWQHALVYKWHPRGIWSRFISLHCIGNAIDRHTYVYDRWIPFSYRYHIIWYLNFRFSGICPNWITQFCRPASNTTFPSMTRYESLLVIFNIMTLYHWHNSTNELYTASCIGLPLSGSHTVNPASWTTNRPSTKSMNAFIYCDFH